MVFHITHIKEGFEEASSLQTLVGLTSTFYFSVFSNNQ